MKSSPAPNCKNQIEAKDVLLPSPVLQHFERFSRHRLARLHVNIAQSRSRQIQTKFSTTNEIDRHSFLAEIVPFEWGTEFRGMPLTNLLFGNVPAGKNQLKRLERAVARDEIVLHGNYLMDLSKFFGSTRAFRSSLAEAESIKTVWSILSMCGLPPLTKFFEIFETKYFASPVVASYLVMIFHPSEFMAYRREFHAMLQSWGLKIDDHSSYQRAAATIRSLIRADDFIVVDRFLVSLTSEAAKVPGPKRSKSSRSTAKPSQPTQGRKSAARPARVWLFQACNSLDYVATQVSKAEVGAFDVWPVTRFQSEINDMDYILLWSSAYPRGIAAIGRVVGQPFRPSAAGQTKTLVTGEFQLLIKFRYERILRAPITVKTLRMKPELRSLSVFSDSQHTNLTVTEKEWAILNPIINSAKDRKRKQPKVRKRVSTKATTNAASQRPPLPPQIPRPDNDHSEKTFKIANSLKLPTPEDRQSRRQAFRDSIQSETTAAQANRAHLVRGAGRDTLGHIHLLRERSVEVRKHLYRDCESVLHSQIMTEQNQFDRISNLWDEAEKRMALICQLFAYSWYPSAGYVRLENRVFRFSFHRYFEWLDARKLHQLHAVGDYFFRWILSPVGDHAQTVPLSGGEAIQQMRIAYLEGNDDLMSKLGFVSFESGWSDAVEEYSVLRPSISGPLATLVSRRQVLAPFGRSPVDGDDPPLRLPSCPTSLSELRPILRRVHLR